MNAERLAELMKKGLVEHKARLLRDLGGEMHCEEPTARWILQAAKRVEEVDALLRSDLVKRAQELLDAAKETP